MDKVKKLLNNQWIVNICTSLIVAGIVAGAPTIWVSITQKVNLKESIIIIFKSIKGILSFKVSIWVIALFIIISVTTLYIITSIKSTESDSRKYPDWYYDFKTMNYKEWIFTWNYEISYNGYKLKDLKPICSCGCNLVEKDRLRNMYFGVPRLVCPNCENDYSSPDYDTKIEVQNLIEYKVRTNTYIKEPVTN